jgi:hexosaminidase
MSPKEEYKTMSIIPRPVHQISCEDYFKLIPQTVIAARGEAAGVARQLADMLSPATGFAFQVLDNPRPNGPAIILAINPDLEPLGDEGYTLSVTTENVHLQSSGSAGLFYAAQSLRQLLPPVIFRETPIKDINWDIPCVEIEDYPRFGWRGLMVDCGRHFMPVKAIKKMIDLLALHKMNVLHWHLTEDQGWRIEVKKYPRLTGVGAWRKETLVGHLNWPVIASALKYDGKPHGGFYSQDEVREVVAYAHARHVNVLPEIEMPGHSGAAVAAYPELGNTGKPIEVRTRWGIHEDIFNANESTILFLQDVLAEVLELFPSSFIHVGGDEAPKKQWKASPAAQARMKELGLHDEEELQSYFIRRMDAYLSEHGRRLIGWDEILEGGLAPNATVMSWRGEEGGIAAAHAGHDVVMAPNTYTYLDYRQSLSPKEPLAIGGYLPLRRVYNYEPIPKGLTAEEARHVLGAQGQLWTEYIPDLEQLEYMAFPRACALAEVAWTPAENKDYTDFRARLTTHLKRLKELKVKYRPVK